LPREQVLSAFVGVRPLARSRPDEPSARSREYRLHTGPTGLISIVGGKYTTYRHMAEVITDLVMRRLGRWRPCRTQTFRLIGAPPGSWAEYKQAAVRELSRRYGLPATTAGHLVQRYGRQAGAVASLLPDRPGLAGPVVEGEPDIRAEFVYQREHEMACVPEDFLLRRTRLGLFRPELLDQAEEMLTLAKAEPASGHSSSHICAPSRRG
jgi:glycerol-3-phosphate dehydrogenase